MIGYFVAGTDTGVGKTRVACGLLSAFRDVGFRVGGMKPVAAGWVDAVSSQFNEDVAKIAAITGQDQHDPALCRYSLSRPVSPHIAAQDCGISIQIEAIEASFAILMSQFEVVVVEGAGGWLTPIDSERSMADVAAALGLPVILVVGLRLGCLNHALLTNRAIQADSLHLAGWVANQIDPEFDASAQNIDTLSRLLGRPPLAVLPFAATETVPDLLRAAVRTLQTQAC